MVRGLLLAAFLLLVLVMVLARFTARRMWRRATERRPVTLDPGR